MYSMFRESDSAGDRGGDSTAFWLDSDGAIQSESNARPRIGVALRVGSLSARSYSYQDWWQTTFITEIIEDNGDHVKFRTGNSVYNWNIE